MSDEIFDLTKMLEGNINRMCVTNDEEELLSMYNWALDRISMLFEIRSKEIQIKNEANKGGV